jgi:hypothetical protein
MKKLSLDQWEEKGREERGVREGKTGIRVAVEALMNG